MSFDQRVRRGLERAADGAQRVDVERSLSRVLARRRRRVTARRSTVAVAAVALAVVTVTVVPNVLDPSSGRRDAPDVVAPAGEPEGRADASSPAGTYAVDVGDSPLAEEHGMTGRWVIELRADGTVEMAAPPTFRGPTSGISYRTQGDTIRVDAFVSDPLCTVSQAVEPIGTYRWTLTAESLGMVPVAETCDVRRLLLAGQTWQVMP
jgi:hypothetical protein